MNGEKPVRICCICGNGYDEYGHNADPVKKARCCNNCNDTVVIPARIRQLRRAQKRKENTSGKT
jgi:hypothetical protein